MELDVLLDSGSALDAIGRTPAEQLQQQQEIKEIKQHHRNVVGVGGAVIPVDRDILITVQIDSGPAHELLLAVMPDDAMPYPVVIGNQTMTRCNLWPAAAAASELFYFGSTGESVLEPEEIKDALRDQRYGPQQYPDDQEQARRIRQVVDKFQDDVFAPKLRSEPANVPAFDIELLDNNNLRSQPCRPIAPMLRGKANDALNELVDMGVVVKSSEHYYSPIVLAPKKDNRLRLCVDFRNLNACTKGISFPLPRLKDMLFRLRGQRFFAALDLRQGFHQVPLTARAAAITSFICPMGLFKFVRLPEGLRNASSYFQSMMRDVLAGLCEVVCEVYIDDVLVYGRTFDEFIINLRLVLERLREVGLQLKLEKCRFGLTQLEFLGQQISGEGIRISQSKLQAITTLKAPRNKSELRSLLGLSNYISGYIKNYGVLIRPLSSMTSSKIFFEWGDEQEAAFRRLKEEVAAAPMLHHLDYDKDVHLRTDASTVGIGGYLFQKNEDEHELPVAFVSRAFTDAQTRWSTIEQELYAIVFSVLRLADLLTGKPFHLETDHRNLIWLSRSSIPKLTRWAMALQEFEITIAHISGKFNVVADALSRLPSESVDSSTLAAVAFDSRTDGGGGGLLDDLDPAADGWLDVIADCHNHVVGHHGVAATVLKVRQLGRDWPGLIGDVSNYIKSCPTCQARRLPPQPADVKTITAFAPGYMWSIDSEGPLPADSDGHRYIVVMVDNYTRMVELTPARSTSAADALPALLSVFSRYGAPAYLRSDQGSQFVNKVITAFLNFLGTGHSLTLAYRPQANGIVERANQEIMRHLRAIVFDRRVKTTWSRYLPIVARIINSTVNSTTGFSPAFLLYGGRVDLSRSLLSGAADSNAPAELKDILVAHDDIEAASLAHINDYIAGRRQRGASAATHLPGSYVLLSYPGQPTDKLSPGAAMALKKVVGQVGNNLELLDVLTGATAPFHVSRVKHFYARRDTDYLKVAAALRDEYVVEAVLESTKTPHGMRYLVRWQGCDAAEDSWEKASAIKETAAFRAYKKR